LIHLRGGLLALSCSSPRSFVKASSADLEEGCAQRQLHCLFLFYLSQARLARHAKEMLCCLTSTTAASRTVIFLKPMYVLCIYCSFRPFSCNVCHINAFLIDFFSFVPSHCRWTFFQLPSGFKRSKLMNDSVPLCWAQAHIYWISNVFLCFKSILKKFKNFYFVFCFKLIYIF